ncbi:hypothetical protein L917_20689 [Phytophthora nicotianae]|uniref:Uncharacterized protein n=1 Tax=Phytophthora nicotianae TaxID=4792 RepID=W2K049_PHYNI|nr:hypothetical protein L917_20689 [Phytophthora nicotianae]
MASKHKRLVVVKLRTAARKLKTSSRHALASRVFLCNKVKHSSNGVATLCSEIWHKHRKDTGSKSQAQAWRSGAYTYG